MQLIKILSVVISVIAVAPPVWSEESDPQSDAAKACRAAYLLDPKALEAEGDTANSAYCRYSRYEAKHWDCVGKRLLEKKLMPMAKHECGIVDMPVR